MTSPNRRDLFRAGAAGLSVVALGSPAAAATESAERSFHYDHVLGTSLDVWVVGSASAAEQAEGVALDEIERLRKVFSLHDAESELCRLNRANGPFKASADLMAVLREYDRWEACSGGALSAQVGGITRAWDRPNGTEPDAAALARAVRRIQSNGWSIGDDDTTVTRHTDQPFNLNSVAKGYILQLAAAAVERVAGISACLVNLGGDMAAWGEAQTLGVQDPFTPAENAPPVTRIRLHDQAVATSGGYMRTYTANGTKHSHILDPRSGRPADGIVSATVIAADCVTANPLATTLCVLGVADGLRLAERLGAAALIVDADGREHRTGSFINFELPTGDEKKADEKKPDEAKKDDKKAEAWPADYQVTLNFELPKPPARGRRPYLAFWIEDADGKAVRTVAVWGSSPKWLPTMSGWWPLGKDDKDLCKAVCKATRDPGKYELVWDGKDDAGKALPQGTYTVKLEVHREHGKDETQTGKIECGAKDAKIMMDKKTEVEESAVKYAKKEKKEK